jgi:hypothetical protein
MKSSQNIQRLGHTKFTSCSLNFVLKTLERASDLKMFKNDKQTHTKKKGKEMTNKHKKKKRKRN